MLPLYFGPSDRPLFGALHLSSNAVVRHAPQSPAGPDPQSPPGEGPQSPPGAAQSSGQGVGVVLCSPLGHEEHHAHRSERHLAERLARAGFPVLRFDYDATGDSAGDDREGGRVEAWRASIVHATSELRRRAGVAHVVLIGLRAGALLALCTAREAGAHGLVLWSPVASGKGHGRELLRLHRLLFPRQKGENARTDDEEALGFALRKDTVADLAKLDAQPPPEGVVQACLVLGGNDSPSEDKLLERLRAAGIEPTYEHHPGHPFLVTDPHKSTVPDEMLAAIERFLIARYPAQEEATGERPTRRPSVPPRSGLTVACAALSEEAVILDGPRRRFGVLTRPRVASGKPAIVLMNAGSIHRVGPNRSFVRMARRWAELGYPVFRMDLSGIGDSAASEGTVENLPYPRDAILDAQAAMGALSERGIARRFILSGLCSGADIAFRTGVLDGRVAGAWMINPQAFYFESSDALKEFMRAELDTSYYKSALWDPARWKRVLRGEVDVKRIAGVVRERVQNGLKRRASRLFGGNLGGLLEITGAPEARDVIADLRTMAERGADTFLLCSEDDPGLVYLLKYFGAELDGLHGVGGFHKEIVRDTDHTFTPLWAQDMLSDKLTEHLTRHHP